MKNWLERTELLVGAQGMERLQNARIAILGLGGVGSAAAEALCRAGIGSLFLIDHDDVDLTNLNRQLVATREVVGWRKVDAEEKRLHSINPDCRLTLAAQFYLPDNYTFLYDWKPDFVIDAIDTVTAKLHLAQECAAHSIPLLTCLGTGNRLDPSALRIGDIADTAGCGCGLARVMRRELRRRGITRQAVLYSVEEPRKAICPDSTHGRHAPGSISFVPPAAGYLLASRVVCQLLGEF